MWGLEQGLRLWVCQQPVSMRYGIRGLTQMVWSWKGHSPASGDVYVFFSKDRKTMKLESYDGKTKIELKKDTSSVSSLKSETPNVKEIYDIKGLKVKRAEKGNIYISNNRKFIAR